MSEAAKDRSVEFYKLAIEALGKRASKNIVLNMFNKVRAHSDDADLRLLIDRLEQALLRTGTSPSALPVREISACKEVAALIETRCNQMLGR